MSERQKLVVCLPGHPASSEWSMHWEGLLLHLVSRFHVEIRRSASNNIYLTRQILANEAHAVKADYVLWIDSDNLVTLEAWESLYQSMEASGPALGILGAWYFFPARDGIKIAAGYCPATQDNLLTVEAIDRATSEAKLLEVDYLGLGMCLMRGSVLEATHPKHFVPIVDETQPYGFCTDDAGFCRLAKERGFASYVHPGVFVEHLKLIKVPAPPVQPEKGEANGDCVYSSNCRSEL